MKQPWFFDKTFVVTGGTSGIGLAISQEILARGGKVIAISHNPREFDPAQKVCEDLAPSKGMFECLKCDITRLEEIEALKTQLEPKRDNLVGLVNNAGITTYGPFFKTPTTDINRLLQINFVGAILFTREIFPLMLPPAVQKREVRYITFTSSTSGVVPFPFVGGYPGCKAGVEMFLKTLEFELPKYVRILRMRPGPVKTSLYDSAKQAPGADAQKLLEFTQKTSLIEPSQVARPLVDAIVKKKSGVLYPNFSQKMLFGMMKMPGIGKPMIRYVSKELRKEFQDL